MTKIKRFNDMNEGTKEEAKIDELLDRIKTLTPEEKALLDKLSKGGKLEDKQKVDPKRGRGQDPRDFLNKILGTNIGPETQITQIGPGEDLTIPVTFGDTPPKNMPKKILFKEGDEVTYLCNTEGLKGKKAKFVRVKEDGKCSIQFEDGKRLAVNPKNLVLTKLDPYGEENWGNEKPPRRGANPNNPWWNGGQNPRDNYSMINQNNVPGDFYFDVRDFDHDGISICMTSIEFWNQNHCWDDSLGSHNLSRPVKDALNRSGVYGEVEAMEAVWEAMPGRTVEFIRQRMIAEGFVHNPQMGEPL
jgi:hypothetical protein